MIGGRERSKDYSRLRLLSRLVGLLALVLVVAALHATSWVSSTLALAFFITMAVWPVDAFCRDRLPAGLRWLGHVAALALVLVLFALFLAGMLLAAQQLAAKLPAYEGDIRVWLEWVPSLIEMPRVVDDPGDALSGSLMEPFVGMASGVLQSTSNLVGILSLVFFLVLLMLVETPAYAAKLRSITGREDGAEYRSALFAIATRIRWYLAVRTMLGVVTGLLYAIWSLAWGVDFALVWGLLALLLNYVPTVGSLLAGILPAAFAFLQLDPLLALAYSGGLLGIEQVMGNYADPKLQGRELSLSPSVVLGALMLWTWIWGIAGALMAVPMTLVLMVTFARIPTLQPLALFLSNCRNADELARAVGS